MQDDLSHSRQCIVYEVNDICEKYKNYEQLNKAGLYAPAESIVDELREQPASIQVRSGWHDSPSNFQPEEFKIQLSGGGPATRIIGELDNDGAIWSVKAQHQHWGIPWTDLFLDDQQTIAVTWFASLFYYGE